MCVQIFVAEEAYIIVGLLSEFKLAATHIGIVARTI